MEDAARHSRPLKRSSSDAGFPALASIKQHKGLAIRHRLRWKQHGANEIAYPCQDDEVAQSMLTRSILLSLKNAGFDCASPVAVESFRADVEEYMLHFLAIVRQSMLSCRRTRPIPQDYLRALHTHQLTLSSLLPHLDSIITPIESQPTLSLDRTRTDDVSKELPFVEATLNGTSNLPSTPFIPQHFPHFPGKHTYKATSEFIDRDQDPRKLRERATEEGRLGEEALRRLVSAGSGEEMNHDKKAKVNKDSRKHREELWRETMNAVTQEMDTESGLHDQVINPLDTQTTGSSRTVPNTGYLSSAINPEKRFWRKGVASRHSAQPRSDNE